MKTTFLILTTVLLFPFLQSQEINLEGTWGIVGCTHITPEGTQKVMEAEIQKGEAITDFYFMKEGKFKQTSNMAGNGKTDTYEGSWKLNGNKLIVTLRIGDRQLDVDYTCEFKEDLLSLTRSKPDGTYHIVNTFRRK